MSKSEDDLINAILKREGGYVDHPADSGGPTNRGITLPALSLHLGRQATMNELLGMTDDTARAIYRSVYLAPFTFVKDDSLRALLLDCAVQHGVTRTVTWLQRACHAVADGILGPDTERRVSAWPPRLLAASVLAQRVRFYGRLVTDNPSQAAFAAGWANRVAEFVEDL